MTQKNKGRDRWHGATPKNSDSQNNSTFDPMIADGYLAKPSRNRQPKRKWTRGVK
jgi:hypothetical protein